MIVLWTHAYGTNRGLLGLFSGIRPEPGSKNLDELRTDYFAWPDEQQRARAWIEREVEAGHETYHCAHLLTGRRRVKENAAPLWALYVDGDGAKAPGWLPAPTAVVESSPGREQFYWRLCQPLDPEIGEALNRRLALTMGGDRSGWDLTQLLRPPETRNHKYPKVPHVVLRELTDMAHDPDVLDRLLPPLRQEEPGERTRSHQPEYVGSDPDLSRLSSWMRDLVRYGNRGEYPCRSRADMAACVAMFGAGFSEAEVWAAMTDPANGISGKFFEKGRHGRRYLSLTIGKAHARTQASPRLGRGKAYARRKGVVSVG